MSSILSRSGLVSLFRQVLDAQSAASWEKLESLAQQSVVTEKGQLQRSDFIDGLISVHHAVTTSKLDSCIVDTRAQAIAARLIRCLTSSEDTLAAKTAEGRESQEIILAWFVDGRLSAMKTLRNDEAQGGDRLLTATTPQHLENLKPTSVDLGVLYRDYIKSINDNTMEANFHTFCKSTVTHNMVEKTIAEYISLIQESQSAIRGLYFDIQDLIVDKDAGRVAARLEFTGVPVKTWADADPTGSKVKFHEHVMYWFDEGKIHWVWSIVDLDTYRDQLLKRD